MIIRFIKKLIQRFRPKIKEKAFVFGPLQTKWIKSLEAHPERQMARRLGNKRADGTYQACCLGEGGLIAGICEWDNKGSLILKDSASEVIDVNRSTLSTNDAYKALGLRNGTGAPESYITHSSLSALNDGGTPWSQIAQLLREQPEVYFTESK